MGFDRIVVGFNKLLIGCWSDFNGIGVGLDVLWIGHSVIGINRILFGF